MFKIDTQINSVHLANMPARSTDELLHQLLIHQLELETQNEALRQTQIELEESRDRWINFYDNSPIGYLTLSPKARITDINLTGAALLGEDRGKLINRYFASFVPPEDYDSWHLYFKDTLQRDNKQSHELNIVRLDGSQLHIQIDSIRLIKKDKATEIRIVLTDITLRKQAEEVIRQSHDQLKRFILQAPISIAMFDRNMNYLAVSDRWLKEYGHGYSDLVGLNHYLAHPNMPDEWDNMHLQALAGTTVENKEVLWIQKDGSKQWLHWVIQPWIDENEKIGGIIFSAENITATKMLEVEIAERRNEIENLQKMHIAAQTASAIAHEMNQPLLAIASYSQAALMMMKTEEPDYAEISIAIERCEQQALRAGRSTRDIISFLRSKEFHTEPFDLRAEIIDIIDSTKSVHNLAFYSVLKFEESLPMVNASRTHLQKVLLNLIRNGLDAIQSAGVQLPVITVTLCMATDKHFAQLSIHDNGTGIKNETLPRLFEPFYTTKANGLGMGLAISRSLIEENGGQLWVDPQAEPGTTFHLTLPFAT